MDYTIAALDDALKLLLLVAEQPGLGVTELARRTENTKARVFRMLYTLEHRGLVVRRGEAALYHLGPAALQLGAAAQRQTDLVQLVQGTLDRLQAELNETAVVRVRDGLETLCIARRESTQSLRADGGDLGSRRPLYAGASGKLLLAWAPEAVQAQVMSAGRTRFTAATLTSKAALQGELASIKRQGYALSRGEHAAETGAIAVPLKDASGQVVAALSLSMPATRMDEANVLRLLKVLQTQALGLSLQLGAA